MSTDGGIDSRVSLRVARAMVRAAGAIHPPRAAEWEADLAFLQSPEIGEAGLAEAWSHLGWAPWLSCRDVARRTVHRDRVEEVIEGSTSLPSGASLESRLSYLPPGFGTWVRRQTTIASTPEEIASVVYSAGNCFAGDPFHVTFVCESDGSLRGLEITGAEENALAISREWLPCWRERLEVSQSAITILGDEEQAELLTLGQRAASYFPDEGAEVVASIPFISGSPLFVHGGRA